MEDGSQSIHIFVYSSGNNALFLLKITLTWLLATGEYNLMGILIQIYYPNKMDIMNPSPLFCCTHSHTPSS